MNNQTGMETIVNVMPCELVSIDLLVYVMHNVIFKNEQDNKALMLVWILRTKMNMKREKNA